MTKTVLGNRLRFKTFNYLKVNETPIPVDLEEAPAYPLPSDERVALPVFDRDRYGVSQEAVEHLENHGNLYRLHRAVADHKECLELKQDYETPVLFDTHDVVAEPGSRLELVLAYEGVAGGADTCAICGGKIGGLADAVVSGEAVSRKERNSLIRIWARENAHVDLFVIQANDEGTHALESIVCEIEEGATVRVHQYQMGSRELCTNFQGNLRGKKAKLEVNSVYFGFGDHKLNLLYNIFHDGEESESSVIVNGVLQDSCYKNFKSTLDFRRGCFFAKGTEEEYAILLDEDVTALSVPVLLAGEDNVEGNHAASAGKLDKELLFYIMSRGFSREEAEYLIVQSRFAPAVDALPDEAWRTRIWDMTRAIIRRRAAEEGAAGSGASGEGSC